MTDLAIAFTSEAQVPDKSAKLAQAQSSVVRQRVQAAHRVRAAILQALDLEALPAALQRAAQEVGVGRGQRGHAPERVLGLVQLAVPAAPL